MLVVQNFSQILCHILQSAQIFFNAVYIKVVIESCDDYIFVMLDVPRAVQRDLFPVNHGFQFRISDSLTIIRAQSQCDYCTIGRYLAQLKQLSYMLVRIPISNPCMLVRISIEYI